MAERHPQTLNHCKYYTPPAAELLDSARGQWREILIDAGLPAESIDHRKGAPCPLCGGRDRFALLPRFEERGAVHCRRCFTRGTDPRPGDGLASIRWLLGCDSLAARRWLAGWLGVAPALSADAVPRPVVRRLAIPEETGNDHGRLAEDCQRWRRLMAERPEWLRRAAELLGLPAVPLERLGVGWSPDHRATTWPMCDAAGAVIGVRLRCPKTARKWAVRGSSAGLFVPVDLVERSAIARLFVAEGPTDTAALLSVGLDAVGVPSAGGGGDLLIDVCRRLGAGAVVIVADADGPGRDGAERLADALLTVAAVRIVSPGPGAKDARAWVRCGADRSVIEAVADAAPVRSLTIGRVGR